MSVVSKPLRDLSRITSANANMLMHIYDPDTGKDHQIWILDLLTLNDYATWDPATTYATGNRVTWQFKIWESLQNVNLNNPPSEGAWWTEVSAGTTLDTPIAPNLVFAGPASGGNAVPSFRALTVADIPAAALERVYVYAGGATTPHTAGLTNGNVQNGDVVKMNSTGVMYVVTNDAALNNASSFEVFYAGNAATVPWSGVTGTPTTIAGYGITDAWRSTSTTNVTNPTISGSGTFNTGTWTFTPNATTEGLNVGSGTPSTPTNGGIWHHSGIGQYQGRLASIGTFSFASVSASGFGTNRIAYGSSTAQHLSSSANLTFDGTGMLIGGGTITPSTPLDVRGISAGNALRVASNSNDPLLTITNAGVTTINTPTGSGTSFTVNASGVITGSPYHTFTITRATQSTSTLVDILNADSDWTHGQMLFQIRNNTGQIFMSLDRAGKYVYSLPANGTGAFVNTASTERHDVNYNLARTVSWATGALATQRAFRIQAPTYAFVGASVITDASTVHIDGPPVAGANATITNPYVLSTGSGQVLFGGSDARVIIGSGTPPINGTRINSLLNTAAAASSILNGMFFTEQTAANTGGPQGVEGWVKTSNATGTVVLSIATIGNLEHSGAGTLQYGRSINAGGILSGNGVITELTGLFASFAITGGGSIGTYYGCFLETPTGAITTRYGVYQQDANAKNYWAGNTSMGTTATSARLRVRGANNAVALLVEDDAGGAIIEAGEGGGTKYFHISSPLGMSGANYGTAGQVLTSNGSGSAPTWQDPSSGVTLAHGTYTPTLTNVLNVASSTAYSSQYMRVGNVVTVSGEIDIDPTAASVQTQVRISLPIASNLAGTNQCAGTINNNTADGTQVAGGIVGDATNDTALINLVVTSTASKNYTYIFTYRVQ